jgi:hypothetical protein
MRSLVPTGGEQRLVHVQRDREPGLDPREWILGSGGREPRPGGVLDRRGDQRLGTGELGQPVDVLGQLVLLTRTTPMSEMPLTCA